MPERGDDLLPLQGRGWEGVGRNINARRGPAHVAILALFSILALALSYPLITHFTTYVPGNATWAFDEYTFVWNNWWFKRAVLDLHTSPLHTDLLFFPLGIDEGLKGDVVGLDIQLNKLRYARRYEVPLTNGDIFCLPFASASFDCVVCSQVLEHLPSGHGPFDEMIRVLRPGGRLVLGTPDYGTLSWPIIERVYGLAAPGAYADEHITHHTRAGLVDLLKSYGLNVQGVEYVFGSELIVAATKPESLPGRLVHAAGGSL
ncbi:MAG: methyltransferase domain-containing protein [Anaerolineales bacterium]|nr:methyltransferase domain-containing protein [Anaerolineales bacterium]